MKTTDHSLFGIITRYSYHHGKKALQAAHEEQVCRARWYANYGMFRYARRMAALFKVGSESEWPKLSKVWHAGRSQDPLLNGALIRGSMRRKTKNHEDPR